MPDRIEIESKLTALDAGVLDELAQLDALGLYKLHPCPDRQIQDRYYDTPFGNLGARRLGFRLRVQDGAPRLTLKRSTSVEQGVLRRPELELPATLENWQLIREDLARDGLHLPKKVVASTDPQDWLHAAGLRLTQYRSTTRRLLLASLDDETLAEVALDAVIFHLGTYDVVYREVEVEALTADFEHVRQISTALCQAYPTRLVPTARGKYARGLDLGAQLAPEGLAGRPGALRADRGP